MLEVNIESFSYDTREVLRDISFGLEEGRHLAIMGESGCGKSTILHLIYGLLDLGQGNIQWKGKPILGPKFNLVPGEDFIKLVAQEFNVMPYTTSAENVATYLSRRDLEKDRARVEDLLAVVELEDYADVFVKNLSGGQKQRIAIAKALANSPELLLLDEPFSNIDTFRKNKLRRRLYNYLKANNISCITATHDSDEALSYADDLLIIKNGTLDIYGPTKDVFNQLDNEYRAGFFGEVNAVPAEILGESTSQSGNIFLLPHQLKHSGDNGPLKVKVIRNYFKGSHYLISAQWQDQILYFIHHSELPESSMQFLSLQSKKQV